MFTIKTTLVVGASGGLGRRIVSRLVERGENVRALSRDPVNRLSGLHGTAAEIAEGDLRDQKSLETAVEGAHTVVYAAHGISPGDPGNTVASVDQVGFRMLVDAAETAGVRHLVFLSAWSAPGTAPCRFFAAKRDGENYLRQRAIPATVIRPTAFMEGHVLAMFGEPLLAGQKLVVLGRGRTPLNFVAVDDLADVVVGALSEQPEPGCRLIEVGGPASYTRIQTIQLLEAAVGLQADPEHVPLAVLRKRMAAAGSADPGLFYVLDAVISEDTHPRAYRWTEGVDGMTCPTTLETVIERWAATKAVPSS
jgi:uncharacterized protein YbjT (DUF2867 family)